MLYSIDNLHFPLTVKVLKWYHEELVGAFHVELPQQLALPKESHDCGCLREEVVVESSGLA